MYIQCIYYIYTESTHTHTQLRSDITAGYVVQLPVLSWPDASGGHLRYITTGSAVPVGADAVVKVEDTLQKVKRLG